MMKKSKNKRDNYNWLLFPQSFLVSSILLCDWLKYKLSEYSPPEFLANFYSKFHSPAYLYFPIIFNFKHGLEHYFKTLSKLCDENYDQGHNLKELLDKLIQKIKKSSYTSKKEILAILDNDIKGIVEKLISGGYAPVVSKGKQQYDIKNQAERYVEHNTYKIQGFFIFGKDENEIITWLTQKVIEDIKKDIEKAYTKLRKIQNILLRQKQ